MRTVAVVLAGGAGQRFGGETPTQLHVLAGRTLLEHSVAAFEQAPGVDEILVVMAAGFTGQTRDILDAGGYGKITDVIEGGQARPDSTRRALPAGGRAARGCNGLLPRSPRALPGPPIPAPCPRAPR